MSYQEIAKNMIDRLPDDKLVFVINILENIGEMAGVNLYPEFKPIAEPIAAMEELDRKCLISASQLNLKKTMHGAANANTIWEYYSQLLMCSVFLPHAMYIHM